MQVYFSHSYRDTEINGHFLEYFKDEDLTLLADQKTDVWCVAKLERYLGEITGFVSIIPRRASEEDPGGYSAYIGRELDLARRARVPRLLFVDEIVLARHPLQFPQDAVPFTSESMADNTVVHNQAIRDFRTKLDTTPRWTRETKKRVALVAGEGKAIKSVVRDAAEILNRANYEVKLLSGRFQDRGLDDIRLLETLWSSELCVFLLGERLSDAHLALAVAHADCIPSIRLQYTRQTADVKPNPTISGVFHWREPEKMLLQLQTQLLSYQQGLIRPLEMANETNARDAAQKMGTMNWQGRADHQWKLDDYPALIRHVYPAHSFVKDEVNRVRVAINQPFDQARDRVATMDICRLLYDGIRRHRFGYEIEPTTGDSEQQQIRTPSLIDTHHTATCLDLACLFAALLEDAKQRALIAILRGTNYRHALAGYIAPTEPLWKDPTIGTLRSAVRSGDAVLFETTGAVEAERAIGAESPSDRIEKLLDFSTAKTAATTMISREDIRLEYLLDVQSARQAGK